MLVRAGWSPPRPDDRILEEITDDIERLTKRKQDPNTRDTTATNELSDSLIRCLLLIAEGYTDAEAAKLLGIGMETVHSQAKDVSRKLGAKNRPHAVAIAFRKGIIN